MWEIPLDFVPSHPYTHCTSVHSLCQLLVILLDPNINSLGAPRCSKLIKHLHRFQHDWPKMDTWPCRYGFVCLWVGSQMPLQLIHNSTLINNSNTKMFSIYFNVAMHTPLSRNYLDQFSGKDLIYIAIFKYYLNVTILEQQEHYITISWETLM